MTASLSDRLAGLPDALTEALLAGEPLTRLATAHALQAALEALRWPLIEIALDAGHTWTEIAAALDDTELGLILDHLHHQHTTLQWSHR